MKTLGEQAEEALRAVAESKSLTYDTETSGLDWKRNHPVGYVITVDHEHNWYIPVRHGGGGNLADPKVAPLAEPDSPTVQHHFEARLQTAFETRRRNGYKTIGHNIKFDMHFSANQGIILGRNVEDTQINEALVDEYASFSLDACAKKHGVTAKLGTELYEHIARQFGCKPDRNSMEHFWRLAGNDPLGVEYALGDGISTMELQASQATQIEADLLTYIHDIESKLIYTVFRMERRGIKIDLEQLEFVKNLLKNKTASAAAKLPAGMNVRSATQLRKWFEGTGRTDWPTTDKGNPSFTEKWLTTFDEGKILVDVRKLTNLQNSFLGPLEDRHTFEGRCHSSLNQMKSDDFGTITGRFSCNNPNLQQVPKRDKVLGPIFRSIFVPDDGMAFYEADYSQCEPRLFAHYAQAPNLVAGYNSSPPKDMHAVTAELLNVERDPTAKRMGMGILTGMQQKSLADHMSWDVPRARAMMDKFFDAYPEIQDFQNTAAREFKRRGWVRTILGRVCRLDNPQYAYRAVSRIIQGSNADILKKKLLDADMFLEESGDFVQLLMTIHDSIEFQAPDDPDGAGMVDELIRLMSDVQEAPFKLRVPFKMDLGSGKNWGEATYGAERVQKVFKEAA